MKNKPLFIRMTYAMSGLRYAFQREKSLRFHMASTLLVIILLLLFQPSIYWWAIVFTVIVMVIAAEMFNTAIEEICDYIQPDDDEKIKHIKDIAAGAVLVTSIGAFVVGVVLLFDLVLNRF